MFSKLKGKAKADMIALLTFIVDATQKAPGYAVVPLANAKELAKLEPTFITIREETLDPVKNVQVFATSLGITAVKGDGIAAPTGITADKPKFVLEEGFTVPPSKRGGGLKADIYPFAEMKVGLSFFVAATEEKPNPAKGLQSTVSSANKRFAATYPMTVGRAKTPHAKAGQPTGQDGRKFTVRPRTTADGEKANGARVYRIQ